MTLGETEEPRTAPKTTEPTKKAEPKRVVTSTSAKPSSKPSKKASSKPSQKASSAPKKRVEPKKASAPKKRAAKPAAAFTGSTKGLKALAYAKAQIGEPYIRNGDGPYGFDCSGLTLKAWAAAGVKGMPHSARQQYSKYKKVSKGNLRKGDLVFFYSPIRHVGLYAGNGKVLHASNPSKPIGYLPMKYMPYAGAVRPG
jgi:cell wall-associated NlpC family hydrolase